MGMKPRKKPKVGMDHTLTLVQGNLWSGLAVYLNSHRICGNKPLGGGTTVQKLVVTDEDLQDALKSNK